MQNLQFLLKSTIMLKNVKAMLSLSNRLTKISNHENIVTTAIFLIGTYDKKVYDLKVYDNKDSINL